MQRTKKRKAVKPVRIARETVVRAALKLLEADGIAGVSTRRLAEELGISGPSLYWHFQNKRELFDHMAEAMLADALPSPDPAVAEPDWQKWLLVAGHSIRRAMLSHRDGAALIAAARPTGEHPTLNMPMMMARLRDEGFSEGDAVCVMLAFARYVLGTAVAEQAALERENVRSSGRSFEFGLKALIAGFELQRTAKPVRKKAT